MSPHLVALRVRPVLQALQVPLDQLVLQELRVLQERPDRLVLPGLLGLLGLQGQLDLRELQGQQVLREPLGRQDLLALLVLQDL